MCTMLSIPVQAASKPPLLPGPQHRPRPAATVLSSARRGRCRDSTGGGGGVTSVLCPPLATPWTAGLQAPLSMGFSRQEYWGGLPFPSPGNLPNPGIASMSLVPPALAGGFFLPLSHLGSPERQMEWGNLFFFLKAGSSWKHTFRCCQG